MLFDVGVTSDRAAMMAVAVAVAVAEIGIVGLGYAIGPVTLSRHMADLPSGGSLSASA